VRREAGAGAAPVRTAPSHRRPAREIFPPHDSQTHRARRGGCRMARMLRCGCRPLSPWNPPDQSPMSGRTEVRHVPKPWGHETIWASNELYVGKILHIKAGQALSTQYHEVKDETVYLLSGELRYRVWLGGRDGEPTDVNLTVGEAFRITPHTIHQMEAVTDCDILEASTPHLDDIVRLHDRYGREGTTAP
jgi:mannose-6-phosphate isomerase